MWAGYGTLLLLLGSVLSVWTEFIEPPLPFSVHTMAEFDTRLPCLFKPGTEKVVQVSWSRKRPDGAKEQVITAHIAEGHTEFGPFSGRVHFESSDPMSNSALIIPITEQSDEGTYTCHIATFPLGSFEIDVSLTVWTKPITSVDPVQLVEGQSFRVAATCRSMAHPLPSLSWDTALEGQAQERSLGAGAVSVSFSLTPLRGMDGKRLDCLVSHATLDRPQRITHSLVVHYPPDATIRGFDGNWLVGAEKVSLRCEGTGNPKPHFTWQRRDSTLPTGVYVEDGLLQFSRPLHQTDSGLYECIANNSVGTGRDSVQVTVIAARVQKGSVVMSPIMIILCGATGALLMVAVLSIYMLMCHHRQRKKRLEMELRETKEQIVSLSRQNSLRRLNSISSHHRLQYPTSQRNSYCTVDGGRMSRAERMEMMARSVIYRGDEEQEAEGCAESQGSRLRLESPVGTSHLSLLSNRTLRPQIMSYRNQISPIQDTDEQRWETIPGDEDESRDSISQISEALSQHFDYSTGVLRPKPNPHAIILESRGQIV